MIDSTMNTSECVPIKFLIQPSMALVRKGRVALVCSRSLAPKGLVNLGRYLGWPALGTHQHMYRCAWILIGDLIGTLCRSSTGPSFSKSPDSFLLKGTQRLGTRLLPLSYAYIVAQSGCRNMVMWDYRNVIMCGLYYIICMRVRMCMLRKWWLVSI